jgi:hypothetical protein
MFLQAEKMRELHPVISAYFLIGATLLNAGQVFHTVGTNQSCFGKIGVPSRSFFYRNLRQRLFIPILQVGTVES